MSRRDRGHKILRSLGLLLILTGGIGMNAEAGLFGMGGSSWKEEVRLHDGQKIVVERSQTYGGRSEPGQSGAGPIKEHRIQFTLPGTRQNITWASEYSQKAGRTHFNLLAVHVLDGVAYVVAEPNLCLAYNDWGRPNPPYVFFRYDGHAWQRIPLEQLPLEFKTINVAHNTLGRDAEELVRIGLVSTDKIKEMNRSSNPVYREILREALTAGLPECETLIWYKCGWGSPSEINRKHFENTCK
jgi:hypothetical protein